MHAGIDKGTNSVLRELWRGVGQIVSLVLQPQQMTTLPAAAARGQVQINTVLFDPQISAPALNAPTEGVSINVHLFQVNLFRATVPLSL